MKPLLLLVLVCCVGCATTAQNPVSRPDAAGGPGTTDAAAEDANKAIASGVSGSDIWLGRLNRGAQWSIDELRNITTRQGYDNQPEFTANGSGIYYTSIRDGAQADIYLYEVAIGAGFRFTATPQSEFSPMPLPNTRGISVVRVETGGEQALWRYSGNAPTRLLEGIDDLGYYTWLDVATVAMFRVTEPPTLALATISDGRIQTINVEPGRSMRVMPATGALSFLDKSDEDQWWVSRYERSSRQILRIAPALAGSEDFAWTPGGDLLMAQGKKIFVWREQWEIVADFEGSIPGDITRLNVDPRGSRIVFVAAEGGS